MMSQSQLFFPLFFFHKLHNVFKQKMSRYPRPIFDSINYFHDLLSNPYKSLFLGNNMMMTYTNIYIRTFMSKHKVYFHVLSTQRQISCTYTRIWQITTSMSFPQNLSLSLYWLTNILLCFSESVYLVIKKFTKTYQIIPEWYFSI